MLLNVVPVPLAGLPSPVPPLSLGLAIFGSPSKFCASPSAFGADDFVLSTGHTHSVRDLVDVVFSHLDLNWEDYVVQNPKYMRPEELKYNMQCVQISETPAIQAGMPASPIFEGSRSRIYWKLRQPEGSNRGYYANLDFTDPNNGNKNARKNKSK